jgi:hypothetical protein
MSTNEQQQQQQYDEQLQIIKDGDVDKVCFEIYIL